jgi:hypothetical protein
MAKNLTLKGIPEALYERLKREATANHRSLNSEIIHRLSLSTDAPRVDPETYLSELSVLQSRLRVRRLTGATLRAAKSEGRP